MLYPQVKWVGAILALRYIEILICLVWFCWKNVKFIVIWFYSKLKEVPVKLTEQLLYAELPKTGNTALFPLTMLQIFTGSLKNHPQLKTLAEYSIKFTFTKHFKSLQADSVLSIPAIATCRQFQKWRISVFWEEDYVTRIRSTVKARAPLIVSYSTLSLKLHLWTVLVKLYAAVQSSTEKWKYK